MSLRYLDLESLETLEKLEIVNTKSFSRLFPNVSINDIECESISNELCACVLKDKSVLIGKNGEYKTFTFVNKPIAVSCGLKHCCILLENCDLYVYGEGNNGQLGLGGLKSSTDFFNKVMSDIISVSCGDNHTICVDIKGRVWGWGQSSSFQLGNRFIMNSRPLQIDTKFVAYKVFASGNTSFIVDVDRNAYILGSNFSKKTGSTSGLSNILTKVTPILLNQPIKNIIVNSRHTLFVTTNEEYIETFKL